MTAAGHVLEDPTTHTTRDWSDMYEVDGVTPRRNPESWWTQHRQTFRQPTGLLFSTGLSNPAHTNGGGNGGHKNCTVARQAGLFLKTIDTTSIQHQLWVSPWTSSSSSLSSSSSSSSSTFAQPLLWEAECDRMQAKLHRIPFIDVAARTTARQGTLLDGVFEVALVQDVLRNWLPWLCQELKKVQEK